MLNKLELDKLQHDLKRASKVLSLVATEKSTEKRNLLISLITDELDRLHSDLDELSEKEEK